MNLLKRIYFENKTIREDYAFLSQVARMIVKDKKGEKDYQTLIERAHLENINCM